MAAIAGPKSPEGLISRAIKLNFEDCTVACAAAGTGSSIKGSLRDRQKEGTCRVAKAEIFKDGKASPVDCYLEDCPVIAGIAAFRGCPIQCVPSECESRLRSGTVAVTESPKDRKCAAVGINLKDCAQNTGIATEPGYAV